MTLLLDFNAEVKIRTEWKPPFKKLSMPLKTEVYHVKTFFLVCFSVC